MKKQLSALAGLAGIITCAVSTGSMAQDSETPLTAWGVPDLQGYWRHNTVMPFERPRDLGTKQSYTEEEALILEQAAQQRVEQDNEPLDPDRPAPKAEPLPPVGNYDLFWTDRGMFLPTIDGEFRTSAIIDPPDGRVPSQVEGFAQRLRDLRASMPGRNDGPEGRSLGERCILSFGNNSGPVMTPVMYNSHMQIVQSPGYVTIVVEMVHDTRIIRIADKHLSVAEAHKKWMGDSIGRWEEDTLVVETKHYNPGQNYRGAPVDNLTVIETFRRESPYKIIYGFTVDDPTVYSAQFSGAYALTAMEEPVYEYACHEGNYGLTGILAGARRLEVLGEVNNERTDGSDLQ